MKRTASPRMSGRWITSGLGVRLAVAAGVSALLWLGFFWISL